MGRKINDCPALHAGDGGIVFKHLGATRDAVGRSFVKARRRIGKGPHVVSVQLDRTGNGPIQFRRIILCRRFLREGQGKGAAQLNALNVNLFTVISYQSSITN